MAGKRMMITLSEKTAAKLEEIAKEKGLTKSVLITLLIEEYSKKGESDERK